MIDRREDTPARKRGANPRRAVLWTPPEGIFLLQCAESLEGMRLAKGEWLGIYQGPMPGGELLYKSRSPLALYRKLKRNRKQTAPAVCWPVSAMRTASKEELRNQLEPEEPDHFRWLRQRAYEAIAEARKRIHDRWGRYSDDEIRRAAEFLRDLSNEARNSGKPKGDRPQAQKNRKMLRAFYLASEGKRPKEIAIEMYGSKNYESKMRSLSVLMERFSQRVGKTYCSCHRCRTIPGSILQHGAHESCWLYLSTVFGSIERWPGVKSNCREHGYALCEALRCYKPAGAEQKPLSVRFDSFQQLP